MNRRMVKVKIREKNTTIHIRKKSRFNNTKDIKTITGVIESLLRLLGAKIE